MRIDAARSGRRRFQKGARPAVAVLALLFASGCGSASEPSPPSSPAAKINEAALSYGPVREGDSLKNAQSKLGPGSVHDFQHLGNPTSDVFDLTVPGSGNPPRPCRRPNETIPPSDAVRFLDYGQARIVFIHDRACEFQIWAEGAKTARGVGVGDSLDRAKAAYPELTCGDVDRGEFGTDHRCAGSPGKGVYLWLGGDPINYIEYEPSS